MKNHGQGMLVTCCDRVRNVQAFTGGSDGTESVCNAGDSDLVPGLGRPLEKGMATPSSIPAWIILQYSFLANSMNRGAWQATVHEIAKSQT